MFLLNSPLVGVSYTPHFLDKLSNFATVATIGARYLQKGQADSKENQQAQLEFSWQSVRLTESNMFQESYQWEPTIWGFPKWGYPKWMVYKGNSYQNG